MSEFSDKTDSELRIPGVDQMEVVFQLSEARTSICEPYSLEGVDELREQSLRLKSQYIWRNSQACAP
jgi:hypothetical protein